MDKQGATSGKEKPTRPHFGVRVVGIGAAAEKLGVHRVYLWQVIHGRRVNPDLMLRFKELEGKN